MDNKQPTQSHPVSVRSAAGDRILCAERGMSLAALLHAGHMALDAPCGGRGTCGKCQVQAVGSLSAPEEAEQRLLGPERLAAGYRLACRARVLGSAEVTLPLATSAQVLQAGQAPHTDYALYRRWGAAIDIGTTTLAAHLYGPEGLVAMASAKNPQAEFGADVMTRIGRALEGEQTALTASLRRGLSALLGELIAGPNLLPSQIEAMVVTGNTTMLHFLAAEDTASLSRAPFAPRRLFGEDAWAGEWLEGFSGPTSLYLPPCIAAFVGADITTALLASGMTQKSETALLVDLGTNGEIALWNGSRLWCSSTAAGPAFEGGGISQGCYGVAGAIDRVWWQDGAIRTRTLGGLPPTGICGSGILDAVAVLRQLGLVEETGAMEAPDGSDAIALAPGVSFTAQDVRQVQLAKGSVRAGVDTLLQTAGLRPEEVDTLYIAGGFGNYLHLESAVAIGLFPKALARGTQLLGNAALAGAAQILQDGRCKETVQAIAKQAAAVELSGNPVFFANYMEGMLLQEA